MPPRASRTASTASGEERLRGASLEADRAEQVVIRPAEILPEGPFQVRGQDELLAFNQRQVEAFDEPS